MPLPDFLSGRIRTSMEAIPSGSAFRSATKARRDSQLNSSEPQNKILRGFEVFGVLLLLKSREWNPWIGIGFDGFIIRPNRDKEVRILSPMVIESAVSTNSIYCT